MVQQNPWLITEDKFELENQLEGERIFTIGNGLITQRGCFEEFNSGNTSKGTFVKGISNHNRNIALPDWTSMVLRINADVVDLCTCEILDYHRVLNLNEGLLTRTFRIVTPSKNTFEIETSRFLSFANIQLGVVKFKVKSIDFKGNINIISSIDAGFNDKAAETNNAQLYVLQSQTLADVAHLWIKTRHANIQVCEAMCFDFFKNNSLKIINPTKIEKISNVGYVCNADVVEQESVVLVKYVSFADSIRANYNELTSLSTKSCLEAKEKGWDVLVAESKEALKAWWKSDSMPKVDDLEKQQKWIQERYDTLRNFNS